MIQICEACEESLTCRLTFPECVRNQEPHPAPPTENPPEQEDVSHF